MTPLEMLGHVTAALADRGLPYVIAGDFAACVWGALDTVSRADVVVGECDRSRLFEVAASHGAAFRVDRPPALDDVAWVRIRHAQDAFYIALHVLTDDPFDLASFSRRVAVRGGFELIVFSAEDTIVEKLRWEPFPGHRAGVEDVRDIIAIQRGRLDLPYIRSWCDRHGTRPLFERLLDEETHLAAFE